MGRFRWIAIAALLGLTTATGSATAKCASPPNCEAPAHIVLVGMSHDVPDVRGEFSVTVRDIANNPDAGEDVGIDFETCAPDIRIATVQPWAGLTVECTSQSPTHATRVHAITDANGRAVFRIVGAATNHGGAPGSGFNCAYIFGSNCENVIAFVNIATLDEDGSGGLNPADLSAWLADAFAYPVSYSSRSDLDGSHTITPADFAILLQTSLAAGSTESAPAYCQ